MLRIVYLIASFVLCLGSVEVAHRTRAVTFADSSLAGARTTGLPHIDSFSSSILQSATGRIAILNDVPFHLEVLAGVLYCLHKQFSSRLDLYLFPNIYKFGRIGLSKWIGVKHSTLWESADVPDNRTAEVLIIISPEYNLQKSEMYVEALKPRVVIAYVHNGRSTTLPALLTLHPRLHLVALSPHVASYVQHSLQEIGSSLVVGWLLAVHPYKPPPQDCVVAAMASEGKGPDAWLRLKNCLTGFCIQGFIDPTRRNYSGLVSQMQSRQAVDPSFDPSSVSVDMVGKIGRKRFKVPPDYRDVIRMHIKIPYLEMYEIIHRSWALLPMLASDDYYDSKFSSTVISSLATGVPMLATPRLLRVYSYLNDSNAHSVPDGSTELEAMIAITKAEPAQQWRRRRHLAALREQLNEQALSKFLTYMA